MSMGPVWPTVHLGSLASARKGAMAGGPFGSDLVSRDYVESGVPVVRGTNLPLTSRFSCENFVFVSPRKADSLHLNCAKPRDLVFTQRGTLGQVGVLPANTPFQRFLISQSQMKMTVDETKACPAFIYYYFRLRGTVSYIESIALQAGVPHINLGILRKFPVAVPPLKNQQRIAAVLAAYDDLIENNRRRIALLERMAEQLYREWFVRFRFPGYQQAKFLKGIPSGWETALASHFFGHVRGKSYTSEELSEDPKQAPFITLKSFNRGGGYRADGLKRFSGRHKLEQLVRQNDVVMAVTDMTQGREVIGRAARIPDLGVHGAVISMDVIKIVPKTISASFLYSFLRLSGFGEFIKEFANGTNVLHLKPDLVTQQRITMPPESLRDQFSAIIEPIFEQIDTLSKANVSLEASRDLLLPRLISGKLRVDDLDIQFPPSMG